MSEQVTKSTIWGQHAKDWAEIQEVQGKAGYDFILKTLALSITSQTDLLDIGCGTGYFCQLASEQGVITTGLDGSPAFIKEARRRLPIGNFLIGEMEKLPFGNDSFDLVCGFNSFQYASNLKNALIEAKRVLKNDGKLVAMIWGKKDHCQITSFLKAINDLLPTLVSSSPNPFALSENRVIEEILAEIGFGKITTSSIASAWDYPDVNTALKGLLSLGAVTKAIENAGIEKVREVILIAIHPYTQANGRVVYQNQYSVIISAI